MKQHLRIGMSVHDEIHYELETAMMEPVYALDAGGVVHLWYAEGKKGFASCGLKRPDIVAFQVEAQTTCLTCLAKQQDMTTAKGEIEMLAQQLQESLSTALGVPQEFMFPNPAFDIGAVQNLSNRGVTVDVETIHRIEETLHLSLKVHAKNYGRIPFIHILEDV